MEKWAVISSCGLYRYRLGRIWNDEQPIMVWTLLNPSTADAEQDDPTLRKCMGFARHHHHGGVILVNLFAYRATNPKELLKVPDPVGPENDEHIRWACAAPILATVIAGWGAEKIAQRRAAHVRTLMWSTRCPIKCLGKTKAGAPRHPLYRPYTTPFVRF